MSTHRKTLEDLLLVNMTSCLEQESNTHKAGKIRYTQQDEYTTFPQTIAIEMATSRYTADYNHQQPS